MTKTESTTLMDDVFADDNLEARGKLLRIIQDFLYSESAKYSSLDNGTYPCLSDGSHSDYDAVPQKSSKENVNMDQLVGNTIDFADSG